MIFEEVKYRYKYCLWIVLFGFILSNKISFAEENILQTRINSSNIGDTIRVKGGLYIGNLIVNKRLVLISDENAVIRGSGSESIITILADSCVLQGFQIEHSGRMLVNEDAGILIKSSFNKIINNELHDILFGIYLLHSQHNLIENNKIIGRRFLDVGQRGSGIHLWNSHWNTISQNEITDTRDGMYIQNANNTTITFNRVYKVRYGLHYMYADSNYFYGNSFTDNMAGAAIMYARNITFRKNIFLRNRSFSSFGVLIQDCHNSTADSNLIIDNRIGIFFEASTNNFFKHNLIMKNDAAIQIFQNSINNTFTENNFIDNLSPIQIIGKTTSSNWNLKNVGNYWDDYGGYDLDLNGTGDVGFKIQNVFDYLESNYPLTRLYLYSPAAQALSISASIFPVIEINKEFDNYPLMQPISTRSIAEYFNLIKSPKNNLSSLLIIFFSYIFFITIYIKVSRKNLFPTSSG